ncbi:MAG: 50S ribosomal protein L38e [Pyrodictiaceae archaeon]
MPKEVYDREEFKKIVEKADECRVKESYRRINGERRKVVKIKARTHRYLYTIVFDDYEEGINYARSLKEICRNLVIIDEHLKDKI